MIDTQTLKRAIVVSEKLELLKAELNSILGGGFTSSSIAAPGKRRGRPPLNAVTTVSDAVQPQRKRRRMSAEGRARIVAAQKARWAKVRRQKTGN